jgi:hypothetical protein
MRRFPVLLIALLAAGCGTAAGTGAPGSSGEDSPVTTIGVKGVDESKVKPPPLMLVSAAGKQTGVPGSSCVQYTDPSSGQGVGLCTDMPLVHPDDLSVIHPGERVIILLAGAFVTDEGSVSVRPLGCTKQETLAFDLARGTSETHWQVELEPGSYELDVFARFRSNDGREGDLNGSLGLLVDADRAHEIVPVDVGLAVCPFSA